MAIDFQNPSPEQIKANQIQDLYRLLYPYIQRDFFHLEDAKTLQNELNTQNAQQVLAFEELRNTFNTHFHVVATSTGPAISNAPTIISFVRMKAITTLPSSLYAQSLVEFPNPPFTLVERKRGTDIAIKPFELE